MRAVAAVAGLLGGLCWVGVLWVDALAWPGAVLLALAVLGTGAGLVSRSAVWLRVLVAVCFLALVASVLQVLRDGLDDRAVLPAAGAVAFVAAALALARRPERPPARRGSHAA
ncbi:hypothetical protein [Nocardioides aquiterrae]|uniref:Uncharacterized protein n=1 Tax=Nocardioides aquiterrae TaxID=203799 RepID=A0ABP4EYC6_9ACTN